MPLGLPTRCSAVISTSVLGGGKLQQSRLVRVAFDRALSIQGAAVEKHIARARQRNPDASPADVVRTLERMYRTAQIGTGVAVGAAAVAPGIGTGVALAAAGGEILSSLELTTLFVLSVAELHGLRVDELERRQTLVMGILLGGGGGETIQKVTERTGQHWAKQIVAKVPRESIKRINAVLGRNFVTLYGTRRGIVVLGRIVPFGVGAAIGGGANFLSAEAAVRAARRAFGPAPDSWSPAPASS